MSRTSQGIALTLLVGTGAALVLAKGYMETPFDQLLGDVGKAWNVSPSLLKAIARHESGFNPKAISGTNKNGTRDYGLMQINERTARAFGVSDVTSLLDPTVNAHLGARLLSALPGELGAISSTQTVIAAYNAGSPAIKTRGVFNLAYVAAVWTHYQLYQLARFLKAGG